MQLPALTSPACSGFATELVRTRGLRLGSQKIAIYSIFFHFKLWFTTAMSNYPASASCGSSDPQGATCAQGCETFSCSCRRANGASGPKDVPLAEATKPQDHWEDLGEILEKWLAGSLGKMSVSGKSLGSLGISGKNPKFWTLWRVIQWKWVGSSNEDWGWISEDWGFNHTNPFWEPILLKVPTTYKVYARVMWKC